MRVYRIRRRFDGLFATKGSRSTGWADWGKFFTKESHARGGITAILKRWAPEHREAVRVTLEVVTYEVTEVPTGAAGPAAVCGFL